MAGFYAKNKNSATENYNQSQYTSLLSSYGTRRFNARTASGTANPTGTQTSAGVVKYGLVSSTTNPTVGMNFAMRTVRNGQNCYFGSIYTSGTQNVRKNDYGTLNYNATGYNLSLFSSSSLQSYTRLSTSRYNYTSTCQIRNIGSLNFIITDPILKDRYSYTYNNSGGLGTGFVMSSTIRWTITFLINQNQYQYRITQGYSTGLIDDLDPLEVPFSTNLNIGLDITAYYGYESSFVSQITKIEYYSHNVNCIFSCTTSAPSYRNALISQKWYNYNCNQ